VQHAAHGHSSSKSLSKMRPWLLIIGAVGASAIHASKHHLFAGSFSSPSIFGVTFDDSSNTLTAQRTATTRKENEWLAISYDGKTLYTSGTSGWSSFAIQNSTIVTNETANAPQPSSCTQWNAANIIASRKQPYSVYGSLYCNNAMFESETYNEKAAVFAMAIDPTSNYLYSADWRNGQIWTHKIGGDGSLISLGSVDAPSAVSAPRSIAIHPSGKSLYVALEGWNAVALYSINTTSHLPVYTKALYTLIPPGM
jgi:carboxy-cis,cis-muconate cyclase